MPIISFRKACFFPFIDLPSLDPVVNISMLYHAVSFVTRNNNMIQNKDPHTVQKPLQLKGGCNVFRRWGACAAGMIMTQEDAVSIVVQRCFHHYSRVCRDFT